MKIEDSTSSHIFVRSERLFIRQPEMSDSDLAEQLYCDPEVMRYLGEAWKPDQVTRVLQMWHDNWGENNHWYGILCLNDSRKPIGMAGVTCETLQNEPGYELSWFILPEYQNKGYASEITVRLVRFVIDELHGNQIIAETHPDNLASNRVLEKLDFTNQGVHHHHYDDLPGFDTQVLWKFTRK
ncbi:MAG: GNAT family N-acetyltransferase [Leptolinea sp.]|nr:GNAT family N-acetyltransferase [Leptolinea sp.]